MYLDVFLWLIRVFIILGQRLQYHKQVCPIINTKENVNPLNKGYTLQFPKTPLLCCFPSAFICIFLRDTKVFQFATSVLDEIMSHYFCSSDVLRTFWVKELRGYILLPPQISP